MSSIEDLWRRVVASGPGAGTRVDSTHPVDLYAAVDAEGHPGLLLICVEEPPRPPMLDALEVTRTHREDGRWALGVWLREEPLLTIFAQLCEDLVESTRAIAPAAAPAFLLSQLVRWGQLLAGTAGPMGMSALRGLVGELLVLERSLHYWSAADVVAGWVGPVGGPQDFVLPDTRIEVKTTYPSARFVRITSAEQLDCYDPLLLAVVTLTTVMGGAESLAPAELIGRIETSVEAAAGEPTAAMFRHRLDAAGYLKVPVYEGPMFRLDGIDFFRVENGFPRIRRADLPAGIGSVLYEVLLGACRPYKTPNLR